MIETAVLIPAYNPDDRLLTLVGALRSRFSRIVLVDDGSTVGREVFAAAEPLVERVLRHDRNRGKGAALKTGFAYLLAGTAGGTGPAVITADADGQHRVDDILRVGEALAAGRKTGKEALVLGVRAFVGKVPLRSRFGNAWTRWLFFFMTGLPVRDTQTGLRGIPPSLLVRVAAIPGERYEYEMAMLADARCHPHRPVQVPIATVYEPGNGSSHFQPLLDSLRIYRSLAQFCLSSVMSFLLDNGLFTLTVFLTREGLSRKDGILWATLLARLVSSHFNYFYNRLVVFRREGNAGSGRRHRSYPLYFALVAVIAAASFSLTWGLSAATGAQGLAITLVKISVDTLLFVLSYWIQKRYVFRGR